MRALNALSPPTGVTGKLPRIFSRACAGRTIFEQNGQNQDFARIKKRAHVPSKSQVTATEVETALDYRSVDFFYVFGGLKVF